MLYFRKKKIYVNKTWIEDIVDAFIALGGDAQYSDLYDYIKEYGTHDFSKIKTPHASIRAAIERASSDSKSFKSQIGGKNDLFFSVDGIGKGHWGLRNYKPSKKAPIDLTVDDPGFIGGKATIRKHVKEERNTSTIEKVKKSFKNKNGKLFCEVCGFNFNDKYTDEIADGFMEIHSLIPLNVNKSSLDINDFVLVCSNCHQMIHRYRPFILNKNELNKILK